MLIPLDFPPGVVKNSTPYKRRGRWEDSNLVRWLNNAIRPIGGWTRRQRVSTNLDIVALIATPSLEAIRDTFAWNSNNQDQQLVFGSNRALYHISQQGVLTTITPPGVNISPKDASLVAGYGMNAYGTGNYGVANPVLGQPPIPPNRWAFANFGELLLLCQRGVGSLRELNPTTLATAVVTNAPASIQDLVVTTDRIVLTIGAGGAPRLVRWSDQENRTLWAPALSNQAGDLTLTGSGKLLRIVNVLQQYLIIGQEDVHIARYVGPPYVFNFELAARNCGPICAEAVVGVQTFAVWWGNDVFWLYDGTVKPLPCEVMDFLLTDVNYQQQSKITGFTVSQFSEVWWLYQSNSNTTTECDSYVTWHYLSNTWYCGRIDRTTGVDQGTLLSPAMVDPLGRVFLHEQKGVFPSEGSAFVESGELDMANGEQNMACRYLYPDTETFGDITVEIIGRQFPTDAKYTYGPYVYNNPTPTRALGRSLKFKFTLNSGSAELGTPRADIAPMGGGRR